MNKNETMIKVRKTTRDKLMQRKNEKQLKSMDAVIDYFFINEEEQSK